MRVPWLIPPIKVAERAPSLLIRGKRDLSRGQILGRNWKRVETRRIDAAMAPENLVVISRVSQEFSNQAGIVTLDRNRSVGATQCPVWVRLGSVGGSTLGPLQPNKQTFIDANVTMTTCFDESTSFSTWRACARS
jgi:hypothetical protein